MVNQWLDRLGDAELYRIGFDLQRKADKRRDSSCIDTRGIDNPSSAVISARRMHHVTTRANGDAGDFASCKHAGAQLDGRVGKRRRRNQRIRFAFTRTKRASQQPLVNIRRKTTKLLPIQHDCLQSGLALDTRLGFYVSHLLAGARDK